MNLDEEPWNISKCRRALRPLQSKIITFRELIKKYPSYLKTEIGEETLLTKFTVKKTYNRSKRKVKSRETQYDYQYNSENELTFCENEKGEEASFNMAAMSKADQRFKALCKIIPQETVNEYKEIFLIFKKFIATVCYSSPTKLYHFASLKLGKCIVVTSKLNNTMFENNSFNINPKTNDAYIDEREWYEFNPGMFHYNRWILLGHGLELINLNIDVLYLIIPTLMNYLVDAGYFYLAKILCSNYITEFPKPDKFWKLYEAGFLKEVCDICGVEFSGIMLNSLTNKITSALIMSDDFYVLEEIYKLLLTSKLKQSNITLFIILKKFKKVFNLLDDPDEMLLLLVNFTQVWFGIFNSSEFNFNIIMFIDLLLLVDHFIAESTNQQICTTFENFKKCITLFQAFFLKLPEPNFKVDNLSNIIINLLPCFEKLNKFLKYISTSNPMLVNQCLDLYDEQFDNLIDYNISLTRKEFDFIKKSFHQSNKKPTDLVFKTTDSSGKNSLEFDINTNDRMKEFEYEIDQSTSVVIDTDTDNEIDSSYSDKMSLIKSIERTISKRVHSKSPLHMRVKRFKINLDGEETFEMRDDELRKYNGSPIKLKKSFDDNFITFRKRFKR